MKIKVSGKKKHESDSDNDDYDSDYSKRKSRSKRDNSDISDAESIPDLPEGRHPIERRKLFTVTMIKMNKAPKLTQNMLAQLAIFVLKTK